MLSIRLARPEDAPRCADIHMRSWIYTYSPCVSVEIIEKHNAGRPEMWKRFLEHNPNLNYVAVLEGTVVGILTIGAARDKDLPEGTGELVGLYLDPAYIGQGIGRQAMDWVKAELKARGFSTMVLWVLDQNDRAKRFYEKCGFAPDGISKPSGLGERQEERYIFELN